MNKAILFLTMQFLFGNKVLQAQSLPATDYLSSLSERVAVVKIIEESPSLMVEVKTCHSTVLGIVVEQLKGNIITDDTIQFEHVADCNPRHGFESSQLLNRERTYLIFISNKFGLHGKMKSYSLADDLLGILDYNEEMRKYLKGHNK